MHIVTALIAANPQVHVDPSDLANKARSVGLIVISLLLMWITINSLHKHSRRGDTSAAWNVGFATLLSFIPLVLGAGLAIAVVTGFSNWIFGVAS